jgi:crossover junction endodeoxyribonuclease RuvC
MKLPPPPRPPSSGDLPFAILGFDPAGAFGWCVLNLAGARLESGTWKLKCTPQQGGGFRLLQLRTNLMSLIERTRKTHRIALIAYEYSVNLKGRVAAKVSGEYEGQVKVCAEEAAIPFTSVTYSDVKRAATGKGSASKAVMVEAADLHWADRKVVDDNEADACWTAEAARKAYGKGMVGP